MSQTLALPAFDAVVAEYEAFAEPATAAFGAHILPMLAMRPGERVLDVAAGTGALTVPLLASGATVVGCDLSPPMVSRLAQRLAEYPRGTAQVEDGQRLSFADGSFDAAVSMFGVMLFPDYRAGLREMVRVLRIGGRAAVGSWTGLTAPMRLLADAVALALPEAPGLTMPPGVDALGSEGGMAAAFADAGLVDGLFRRVTLAWTSPPLDSFMGHAQALFRHIAPVPTLTDAERSRLFAAMAQLVAQGRPFDSSAILGVGYRRS